MKFCFFYVQKSVMGKFQPSLSCSHSSVSTTSHLHHIPVCSLSHPFPVLSVSTLSALFIIHYKKQRNTSAIHNAECGWTALDLSSEMLIFLILGWQKSLKCFIMLYYNILTQYCYLFMLFINDKQFWMFCLLLLLCVFSMGFSKFLLQSLKHNFAKCVSTMTSFPNKVRPFDLPLCRSPSRPHKDH